MNNKLKNIAMIAEIVGGLAVLVTLIILVFQISQSTRAMRAQTAQNTLIQLMNYSDYLFAGPPDRLDVFQQLTPELEDITTIDSSAFPIFRRLMYVYDNAYYQFQQGTLDDDVFSRYRRGIDDFSNRRWFPGYWEIDKRSFTDSFQLYVENIIY